MSRPSTKLFLLGLLIALVSASFASELTDDVELLQTISFPRANLPNHKTICQWRYDPITGCYLGIGIGTLDTMPPEGSAAATLKICIAADGSATVSTVNDVGFNFGFVEKSYPSEKNPGMFYVLFNSITYPAAGLTNYTGVLTLDFATGHLQPLCSPQGRDTMASVSIKYDPEVSDLERVIFTDSNAATIFETNDKGTVCKALKAHPLLAPNPMMGPRTGGNGVRCSARHNGCFLGGVSFPGLQFAGFNDDGSLQDPEYLILDPALVGCVEIELSASGKSVTCSAIFSGDMIIYDVRNLKNVTYRKLNAPGSTSVSQLIQMVGHPFYHEKKTIARTSLGFDKLGQAEVGKIEIFGGKDNKNIVL